MQFNEGKACDAVLRYLESRDCSARSNIRWPEQEHHAGPVELVCNVGNRCYALEHTGIEPFEGFIQLNNEDERVFGPIEAAINPLVPEGEVWELSVRALGLQGRSGREVAQAQKALIDYVRITASTLQKRRYADYRNALSPASIPNVPFPVSLHRFQSEIAGNVPGFKPLLIRHVCEGDKVARESLREKRIERACDAQRFNKLAVWKKEIGARTVLILENTDLFLTNEEIIAQAYLRIVSNVSNRPDEAFLFDTALNSRWYLWPLQIGQQTFFDIYCDTKQPLGKFAPTELISATNR
jgi:hypothetical protein